MVSTVIVLLSLTGLSVARDWSHHDEDAWPGQCGVGKEQSPINIVPHESLPDPHEAHIRGPLVYRGYGDVEVRARNTGYKVRWAVEPGTPAPVLSGGPLRDNYTFAEVHFHWLSEHAINGLKYPMEIHFVHLKTGLNFDQALQQRDGVAVVGVLVQVGPIGETSVLEELLPAMDYIVNPSNEDSPTFNVDLTKLFSPNPQAFYTYHGSLTTPLCPEVVTWMVMDQPTTVTHDHYKNLTRADLEGINNDRRVQPLGTRMVYRSKEVASCSHMASPSLLGLAAAIIACFRSKMSTTLLGAMCSIVKTKRRLLGNVVNKVTCH
ncbi:putative carbonic anhydrase 3 [Ostrinia furnacalis]|uniref:putative carbonic anhydrase 3 n=1 Tax=Ostrinia furnacalis TaxID=93504 RepID=UPI00103D8CA7|nr:putative carbonic anhydrase 3 [Ostrinia furnacalis]